MKSLLLIVTALGFIIFIIAAGGSFIGAVPFWRGVLLLSIPLIFDIFLIRSTKFLAQSTPILINKITRVVVTHITGLIVFVFFQLVFLFSNSGLLSILFPKENWEIFSEKLFPYIISIGAVAYIISTLVNYLIIYIEDGFEKEQKIIKRELQIKKGELNVLKSVIQPHFLFNSFNTLTALIETGNKTAGEFCRGLSDYLRYSLKYSNRELVTVEEELENLSNYLKIEKIRMGKRLKIELNISDDTRQKLILPFSIITFAENGIKHGISNYLEGGILEISTEINKNQFIVSVVNPKTPNDSTKKEGEGIGISTLKKRLFIVFKERATIKLFNKGDKYYSQMIMMESTDG